MSVDTITSTPRATRREWIGLAVLALPTLLLSIDISVLYLALPRLSADLGASSTQQLWILDIYSFMIAGLLVTMGTLGDRIGRRKLLLLGGGAFGIASVIAAYATTPEMLIAARALLGIAGATLMPSTMALIRNMFPNPQQMAFAISVWFSCFMGGMTVGPLVGGLLLEHFWWGSAFLLGVPFMVMLLVVGPRLLPEYRDPNAGRLDPTSVVLSLAAILPMIYGLKETAKDGWQLVPIVAVLVGAAFAVTFIRRQRLLPNPLLDVTLFRNRAFSTGLGVMLGTGVIMAGISLLSAVYLQTVVALSPMQAGLWLIPQNIAMVVGSLLAPAVARRVNPTHVTAAGLGIASVGFVFLTQVGSTGGLGFVVIGLVIAAFGVSLPMAMIFGIVLAAAPPEKAGSAAGVSETSGEFGIAMGVATVGSLGAYVYRDQLADTIPAGTPAQVAEAAQDGIAVALTAAHQLGGPVGADLAEAARAAFTSGLNVGGAVGLVGFLTLAVVTLTVLRRGPAAVEEPTLPVETEVADTDVVEPGRALELVH